ncbi:hypothetical protein HKX48_008034 [Thoreauomyces humboldtii]|nr:hypothetical protein HKX48_008034 [Thoreauomyces humboldtii]
MTYVLLKGKRYSHDDYKVCVLYEHSYAEPGRDATRPLLAWPSWITSSNSSRLLKALYSVDAEKIDRSGRLLHLSMRKDVQTPAHVSGGTDQLAVYRVRQQIEPGSRLFAFTSFALADHAAFVQERQDLFIGVPTSRASSTSSLGREADTSEACRANRNDMAATRMKIGGRWFVNTETLQNVAVVGAVISAAKQQARIFTHVTGELIHLLPRPNHETPKVVLPNNDTVYHYTDANGDMQDLEWQCLAVRSYLLGRSSRSTDLNSSQTRSRLVSFNPPATLSTDAPIECVVPTLVSMRDKVVILLGMIKEGDEDKMLRKVVGWNLAKIERKIN